MFCFIYSIVLNTHGDINLSLVMYENDSLCNKRDMNIYHQKDDKEEKFFDLRKWYVEKERNDESIERRKLFKRESE